MMRLASWNAFHARKRIIPLPRFSTLTCAAAACTAATCRLAWWGMRLRAGARSWASQYARERRRFGEQASGLNCSAAG
jgi:hypothetical protein